MGNGPVFDEYGMLNGPGSDPVWEQLCTQLEGEFHLTGWDQPARLFAILSPEETLERRGASSVADSRATLEVDLEMTGPIDQPSAAGADALDRVMDLVELSVEQDPVNAVWGQVTAPSTPAVLMVWEADGWLGPATERHDVAPTRTRFVSLVTRAGRQVTVARARGSEPLTVPKDWYLGRAGLALRRVVGVECPPAPLSVQHWLGRIVLGHAAPGLVALGGDWVPDPDQLVPESMARQVAEAPLEHREQVQAALARRVTTSALALVVTLIFGNLTTRTDEAGITLRELVRTSVASARDGDGQDLVELAEVVGERSWGEVLADQSVAGVLTSLVLRHRQWCDANLLAWVSWESHPAQQGTLAALHEATNDAVIAEVTTLLARAGWLEQG